MFRTHKHAEIPISALFGDEARLWGYVEHGLHQPWFYVTLTERHDELTLRNMLMVSDVRILESLVSEQHRDMKIDAVQLVSPCYMNESSQWMMEPLLELSQITRTDAEPPAYIYILEGGRQYLDGNEGPLSEEQISSRKVIFSALA
ncbi:hypothetical protein [Pseudomonas sp. OTU750018]|uniref:hypothetical protein n=1 Tax=Pseudomonas sp. OTU750018 TaxID=2709708 RepID=UPI0014237C58|nr:hypothetical protein [Pseudomonas sp. OTU750018]